MRRTVFDTEHVLVNTVLYSQYLTRRRRERRGRSPRILPRSTRRNGMQSMPWWFSHQNSVLSVGQPYSVTFVVIFFIS